VDTAEAGSAAVARGAAAMEAGARVAEVKAEDLSTRKLQ
jgi:hypothetical protein